MKNTYQKITLFRSKGIWYAQDAENCASGRGLSKVEAFRELLTNLMSNESERV